MVRVYVDGTKVQQVAATGKTDQVFDVPNNLAHSVMLEVCNEELALLAVGRPARADLRPLVAHPPATPTESTARGSPGPSRSTATATRPP